MKLYQGGFHPEKEIIFKSKILPLPKYNLSA
jgi:hypothetical protein